MTDLLSIGSSGLRAYRDAMGTTSDNISNAQTAGYVRRTLRLEEATAGGNSALYRASVLPGGVLVGGVQRAVDQFLVEDSRVSIGNAERTSARDTWLSAGERALNDGPNGVGASVTAIFNAADILASDPSSTGSRVAFLRSVAAAADNFRATAEQLQNVSKGIADTASVGVDQLNTDLAALQRVNDALLRARDGSTGQASLLDDRDRLLDSISAALPITITYGERGNATVHLAGSGNETLLDGPQLATFAVSAAPGGQLSLSLNGNPVTVASGSLSGLISSASDIADRRTSLDQLAAQFASQMNSANQAGLDANGNPGAALLSFGGTAASLVAISLTPDKVAAADASSDNGNMLALSSLRGPGGVEQGWAQLASVHAQLVASARAEDSAASTRRDGALQARNELSGVDLDHEAADLLRFQQAYEASARVIQVAREAFQSILSAI